MKRRTLNETWKQCLKMWKWIAKEEEGLCRVGVETLKTTWLIKRGFNIDEIKAWCFFCDYRRDQGCGICPGRKIDKNFDCQNESYCYYAKPILFYKELLRLNKIRLTKGVRK